MSSVVSIMLDTKEGHCKNKSSFIGCFRFCFFDKRSSIGIKDKYNFSMVVVPHYARVSYFIVAFLKTVYVALFRCIALSKD